jgi:sugar lactone lactonase YvrE
MLVVSMKDQLLLRLDPDGLVIVADLSDLASYTCNDLVVDREGNAYVGNFGYEIGDPQAEPRFAEIILVRPSGEAGIVARGMAFPNGMVITPDDATLIVAESSAARLTAFTITLEGFLVERRIWAEFDKRGLVVDQDRIIPDGICLDTKGGIWVASPGKPGGVMRVLEGGEITDSVAVEYQAFAAMLGGPDGKTLFVCTSTFDDRLGVVGRIDKTTVEYPHAGLP